MRKPYSNQRRLDIDAIENIELNLNCRDEMIPILRALQHIYQNPELRNQILRVIADDINAKSRRDIGRRGFDDWQILVLAAVRLGCNLDYDKLEDLAEQHRALRAIMGVGDWDTRISFDWRRIRDTLCQLKPETIEQISHFIVAEGHTLVPDAAKKHRVDSFVVETDIHYPTESSLILDGMGKVIELAVQIAAICCLTGWRQHEHLLKDIKRLHMNISRISRRKGGNAKRRMEKRYRGLLKKSGRIIQRARDLIETAEQSGTPTLKCMLLIVELKRYIDLTEQVRETARRRVLQGEQVPNGDKIFSIFEPHTQLYRRGKAGEPNQFGRLVLVYEDSAGFVTHHYVMSRTDLDAEVAVEQTRIVQERLNHQIEDISFDRGFYNQDNASELKHIVPNVCLPKNNPKAYGKQMAAEDDRFKKNRKRHPGIESAIGALQSGNGLKRGRDHGEVGFERYVAIGILGRNLHVLGKILIQAEQPDSKAAFTKRQAA